MGAENVAYDVAGVGFEDEAGFGGEVGVLMAVDVRGDGGGGLGFEGWAGGCAEDEVEGGVVGGFFCGEVYGANVGHFWGCFFWWLLGWCVHYAGDQGVFIELLYAWFAVGFSGNAIRGCSRRRSSTTRWGSGDAR